MVGSLVSGSARPLLQLPIMSANTIIDLVSTKPEPQTTIVASLDQYRFTTPTKRRRLSPATSNINTASNTAITPVTPTPTPTKANKRNTGVLIGLTPLEPLTPNDPQPTTLVLGSMPSEASLKQQQYYAYKQNHFWPVMSQLLGTDLTVMSYDDRCNTLRQNQICVWDVIRQCVRPGSLDSDIRNPHVNDFDALLQRYTGIRRILNNGQMSFNLFSKHVVNKDSLAGKLICERGIEVHYVPSTSPAHAVKNAVEVKSEKWRIAMNGGSTGKLDGS